MKIQTGRWSSSLMDLLGIKYPIIQGPFGGGLSTSRLVAEVSNFGGLGSYGAHILSSEEIVSLADEIRTQTDKPFALNLWVSDRDADMEDLSKERFDQHMKQYLPLYETLGESPPQWPETNSVSFENQVEAILHVRPRVFSFVFGIPPADIINECHRRNILTLGAATTVEEAMAVEEAGIDMVLATGFEAGGHRPSFLRNAEDSLMGTMALVPLVKDRVKIPVIAAGGIADHRGVQAAFQLGANAVQVGTAFLACEESGASAVHREALFQADDKTTILSKRFTGRLARFQENGFLTDSVDRNPLPFPAQSWLTTPIKQGSSKQGNLEYMALYSSQAAPLIKYRQASEVITSLLGE